MNMKSKHRTKMNINMESKKNPFLRSSRQTCKSAKRRSPKRPGRVRNPINLEELSQLWWEWARCASDPWAFDSTTCAEQGDKVPRHWHFFAGGNDDLDINERECTMPKGKSIFMPLVNFLCSFEPYECDDLSQSDCKEDCTDEGDDCKTFFDLEGTCGKGGWLETQAGLEGEAYVDGIKWEAQLVATNTFTLNAPCDDFDGLDAAATGLWIVIPRLSKGCHTIDIFGKSPLGSTKLSLELNVE